MLFVLLAVIAAVLAAIFLPFHDGAGVAADLAVAAPIPAAPVVPGAQYLPPRAAEAPEAIRDQVLRGQSIMTRHRDPGRPLGAPACSSCHFAGGLSEGGRNHGFSLVGVAAHYPGDGPLRGLAARIASCFRTNLNQPPPDAHGETMAALEAYLGWISAGVPFLARVPWLRSPPLAGTRPPDPEAGRRIFTDECSTCHGEHGEGTRIAPATWGKDSFTSESQLLAPGILERFIQETMPRGNPTLADQAAVDVAAFVRRQPRLAPSP